MARERLDLPAYLGSTLRGAFGHVFRSLACPARFNQPCPIPNACPYHLIFETAPPPGSQALRTHEEIPRPFVISPITDTGGGWMERGRNEIAPGGELSFDLTLIGRAQEFFPYFVVAFREINRLGRKYPRPHSSVEETREETPPSPIFPWGRAGERVPDRPQAPHAGIPSEPSASEATRDQREAIRLHPAPPTKTVELRRIDLLDPLTGAATPVYDAADNLVHPMRKSLTLSACAALPPPSSSRFTIDFLTQTRLKHEGGFTRIPEFQIVFRRLLGRLSSLSRFHCNAPLDVDFKGLIDQAASIDLIQNDTRWTRWQRYSSRQRQRMEWEGVIGRAVYGRTAQASPPVIPTEGASFCSVVEGSTRSNLPEIRSASAATEKDSPTIRGELAPFWKFLKFGEFVHVGHGCTFGLGRYRIAGM